MWLITYNETYVCSTVKVGEFCCNDLGSTLGTSCEVIFGVFLNCTLCVLLKYTNTPFGPTYVSLDWRHGLIKRSVLRCSGHVHT